MSDAFFRALEKMDSKTANAEHNIKVRQKRIKEMIEEQKRYYSDANETVLEFIAEFSHRGSPYIEVEKSYEAIRSTFRAGYCYYFAHMLKLAFDRGCVCWTAPFSHIVWVDTDGIPYDIEGVYAGEADYFIPEDYIQDSIWTFKHIPNSDGQIRDADEIISIFESDMKSGGLTLKGLDYVVKGY